MQEMKIESESQEVEFKNKRKIGKLRQFLATVCLGPISLGSSLSWTSPVLPQLLVKNSTNSAIITNLTSNESTTNVPLLDIENNSTFTLTVEEGSWIGSMLAIGVLITAIPSGYLAGRFGLKKSSLALLVPNLLFTIIVLCSQDVYTMCLARLFSGISTGGISVVGPMYISEIADVSLRGTLGSFFEFLIYMGVVFVAICGAYLPYKTLTIVLGVLGISLGSVFFFLPESPAYLIKRNKRAEAEKALKFYRSEGFNIDNALDELYERVHAKTEKRLTFGKR